MVNGWLLLRIRKFNEVGMYAWAFHSIWRTTDGELLDITDDKNYVGSEYSTFWYDAVRTVDLVEGINYNNVMTFGNDAIANHFSTAIGVKLASGVPFWTTQSMKHVRPLDMHSGQYRWITSNYPNNIARMEERYNVKVVNGKLTSNGLSDQLHTDAEFDFSISSS